MPGCHWSRSFALRPGVALGERPDHPEHVGDRVLVGVPELAHGLVERRRQRPAQPLVGPGLELAGAPATSYGGRAQRVEQHGLADAAQPGQHDAALGPPFATRSSTTSKARSCASRPASSGGRWPAPGAYGLRIGSMLGRYRGV